MKHLSSGSLNKKLISLFVLTAFVRLWRFGVIPPVTSDTNQLLRLLSCGLGIGSVFLLYHFVQKLFRNQSIAFWSAFWLSVSPWHVAESRIISPMMMVSFVLLLAGMCLTNTKKLFKDVGLALTVLGCVLLYRFSWVYFHFQIISGYNFIKNNLRYLSPDFLFFFNDSFWWGGFKETGILVSFALFPLIIGLHLFFSYSQKQIVNVISILFLAILFFSSASPVNPETQEFFLALPILATLTGMGTAQLQKRYRIIFTIFLIGVMFQLFQTWHIYNVHYFIRVQNELPYVKRIF